MTVKKVNPTVKVGSAKVAGWRDVIWNLKATDHFQEYVLQLHLYQKSHDLQKQTLRGKVQCRINSPAARQRNKHEGWTYSRSVSRFSSNFIPLELSATGKKLLLLFCRCFSRCRSLSIYTHTVYLYYKKLMSHCALWTHLTHLCMQTYILYIYIVTVLFGFEDLQSVWTTTEKV